MKKIKKFLLENKNQNPRKLVLMLKKSSIGSVMIRNLEITGTVSFLIIGSLLYLNLPINAQKNDCGNGVCENIENSQNCPSDCGIKASAAKIAPGFDEKQTDSYKMSFNYPADQGSIIEENKEGSFLIKFKDVSLSEKEKELKKKVKAKELTEVGVKNELKKYYDSIGVGQKNYKAEIRKINKSIKFKHDFKTSLNGINIRNANYEDVEKIKNLSFVEKVEIDERAFLNLLDSKNITGAANAWGAGFTGTGIKVAIIDTGVDYTHVDLGGCFGPGCKVVGGYDFYNNDADPMDDHGHGTHVAGIVAANGVVKGVAYEASLYAYKVCGYAGNCYDSDVVAGIDRALDPNNDGNLSDHANVMNISLGGPGSPDDLISKAVDNAVDAGIVAAIAAGNSGPGYSTINSPGTSRNAITVGAVDKSNVIASFSSKGPTVAGTIKPDIVAPGVDICSTQWANYSSYYACIDSDHVKLQGTSMASPHVAGAAALLLQAHADWTPNQIKYALRNTASQMSSDVYSVGFGSLNIFNAVSLAQKPPVGIIDTYGEQKGIVDIVGRIEADNFSSYILEYGEGYAPTAWTSIVSSTTFTGGVLAASFDTSLLKETVYTLRLKVVSGTGETAQYSYDYASLKPNNVYISSPSNGSIQNQGSMVIIGTVGGTNMSGYRVEYSPYNANQWTQICAGNSSVVNGELGTWNYSAISAGLYELRVVTTNSDGHIGEDKIKILIDMSLVSGWPLEIQPNLQGLNFADFDNNGVLKLITSNYGSSRGYGRGALYAISPDKTYDLNFYNNTGYYGDIPSAGSLNDIPGDEIQLGVQYILNNLDKNANNISGWPKSFNNAFSNRIVAADLDGDGQNELIYSPKEFNSTSRNVYVYKQDGTLMSGWPQIMGDSLDFTFSVGDINQDGYKEIAILGFNQNLWKYDIYVKNYLGQDLPGWPKNISTLYIDSMVMGDINNDGKMDLIFGGSNRVTSDWEIKVWDNSGNDLAGWPKNLGAINNGIGNRMMKLILGNLDGDSKLEMVASVGNEIYVLNDNGVIFNPFWPKTLLSSETNQKNITGLLLADINNDQASEILAYYDILTDYYTPVSYIGALKIDGTFLREWVMPGGTTGQFAVTDFNHNGTVDLIGLTNTYDPINLTSAYIKGSKIYFWDLNVPHNPTRDEWPMIQRNKGFENSYPMIVVCVDKDGDGFDNCNLGDSGDDGKAIDCNDDNRAINPAAMEICGNGVDENCSAADDACVCGNGLCELGENCTTCSQDCISNQTNPAYSCSSCSRGKCDGACGLRERVDCFDCAPKHCCGNGTCESGETIANCKVDCGCKSDAACNDNKSCTADTCGTDGLCKNVWPVCGLADGCCAANCTSLSDSDCQALNCGTCQNGVCDGVCNKKKENATCPDCK